MLYSHYMDCAGKIIVAKIWSNMRESLRLGTDLCEVFVCYLCYRVCSFQLYLESYKFVLNENYSPGI